MTPTQSLDALLAEGIAAIKANDRARGYDLLLALVEQDGGIAQAWMWLAAAVESKEERRYCLQLAVEIDPDCLPAYQGLSATGPGPARRPHQRPAPPCTATARSAPSGAAAGELPPQLVQIYRALAADPQRLGCWLGYGQRLVDEAAARS